MQSTQNTTPLETVPDNWDRMDVYRYVDMEGKPVIWHGQKISPDYRPGHTTHPEIRGRGR